MTKKAVRALAAERNVPVSDKPDSQDFYGGEYAELLGVGNRQGKIVDTRGTILGAHDGYWRFTPGQRKGLGVAFTEPLYVLRIEPEANRIVVGTKEEELSRGCVASSWVAGCGTPTAGLECLGRVRSAQPLRPMRVAAVEGGVVTIEFAEQIQGVAPGQSLVLYKGDAVLGGGVIQERLQ
jgi:tRNA-specific 2-thiouridylase